MLSAICFNLDQSKILSSGNGSIFFFVCRSSDRYDSRGMRGRDGGGGRRDPYGRDYDRRDRRYSPPRRDISPPHKRMRRDWYAKKWYLLFSKIMKQF